MSLTIRTNVASLNAQRNLTGTQSALESSLSRLSSGFRITRAGDDAAGLGISTRLESQIRSYTQATRNANDGVSLVQATESALTEQVSILTRLRELAMQSASDGIGDTERGYADREAQQLVGELERIAQVTEYNGTKLLDGSNASGLDFHVGIGQGVNDVITLKTVNSTTAAAGAAPAAPPTGMPAFVSSAATTFLSALAANGWDEGAARATTAALASPNAEAANWASTAIHEIFQGGLEAAGFTLGDEVTNPAARAAGSALVTAIAINGDYAADPVFQAAFSAYANNITSGGAPFDAFNAAEVAASTAAGAVGFSQLVSNATYGAEALFLSAYTASTGAVPNMGLPVPAGAALDAGLAALGVGGGGGGGGGAAASTGGLGVAGLSVASKGSALAALGTIDAALASLSSSRADLGATGNRLQSAIANIQAFSESLSAANSRIKDVDVAEETARMARSQILSQAGVSVLAQANQLPQLALKLLG